MVMYHLSILDAKGRDQCAEGVDSMWGQVLAGFVLSTWLGLSQRKELQLGKCLAADPLGSLCLSGTGLWGRWTKCQREWQTDQHERLCRIWMYCASDQTSGRASNFLYQRNNKKPGKIQSTKLQWHNTKGMYTSKEGGDQAAATKEGSQVQTSLL